ncbi:MAG TPA: hypothetical protein DCS07_12330 [Bdellovibrionales bacterium]|nr:MAG: hypothetical protein A2Z97_03620 [Bdellovibrionales bacterium GWB1_52_6]OFZ02942.1 MAG: hypothetical protein A2X97_05050 [Bdellovibrionales bacterium GWA1_52_35]HAR43396.1 hypothetical protein [Bdellovibrionales bacterium]HCM38527.1 hypothetical protein [Bdellovibrionales bacterium]
MNFQWNRTRFFAPGKIMIPVLLSFTLVYCADPMSKRSNLETTNEEAQASLEVRLKKTDEVRVQLNSIRDALRPIESVFTDISNGLNARVTIDGKPADRFKTGIERLRLILKESTKGVVQNNPDGSWMIQRKISLPLGRKDYACKSSELHIFGSRVNDHEEMQIFLTDCSSIYPLQLVSARAFSDHLEVQFFPETLDTLIQPEMQVGQCSVRIQKNNAQVQCEPIEIMSPDFTAVIHPLDFASTSQGIDASVKLNIRDKADLFVAELRLEAHPGFGTQIDVRTKE